MGINSFPPTGGAGGYEFPSELIDPVSKFRVSNPENLIDTDFEYGLQPTKWETVELINNTPSFFSKSGDTTIDGISSIITNAGTREIIVKTELDHGLAVGIPINVTGTKSITADGSYIINSIPDTKTFTYLCKDDQDDTASILDLYSSIITGEFFQGSQLRVSDSEGIVTDAEGTSELTVTTNSTHGFGTNTPFYFLNLNSTVAQEFQAANTASKTFDASNSATAQTFDGSNTLSSFNIDWSNSAVEGGTVSNITSTDTANSRITVSHTTENFASLPLGTPLYYSVSAVSGYFNTNPRGVVFLKTITSLGTSTSTFQVSLVPDGEPILFTTALSGTFQLANQARTFAGNNINPLTQTVLDIEVGTSFNFDGGNQGYTGAVQGSPPNNTLTVASYSTVNISANGASAVDYYTGAMVKYETTGTVATGLVDDATYFVKTFVNNGGGSYTFSVSELPGSLEPAITISGGTGTQTFSRIGVSIDKDILHIPDSNFAEGDMIEYSFPTDGRFDVENEEQEKLFYFIDTAYDNHNYLVNEDVGFKPIIATGGTILPDIVDRGRTWRVHEFTTVGTQNFVISNAGKEGALDFLVVAGGGGSGWDLSGGGGGGGVVHLTNAAVPVGTYPIVVGDGGRGASIYYGLGIGQENFGVNGENGQNSSAFGYVAVGGGGSGFQNGGTAGNAGGSGGGAAGGNNASAGGASTQPAIVSGAYGNAIGYGTAGGSGTLGSPNYPGGGGGGAGQAGQTPANPSARGGKGGDGIRININGNNHYYGGGGGGAAYESNESAGSGGYGGGGGGGKTGPRGAGLGGGLSRNPGGNGYVQADGVNTWPPPNVGGANTGGGAGGAHNNNPQGNGAKGGSGIVIIRYPLTAVAPVPTSATGGATSTITVGDTTYRVHTFTTVGNSTFTMETVGNLGPTEYLIVAGGGGGGFDVGGGGGAGGLLQGIVSLNAQSYTITVGGGGAGAPDANNRFATNGSNSSAFGLTALGGGRGGSWVGAGSGGARDGGVGGSGGGGGGWSQVGVGGAGTAGQGSHGGDALANTTPTTGGGGGGAGGPGANQVVVNDGFVPGGPGLVSSISGAPVTYATGGRGGGDSWNGAIAGAANTGNGGDGRGASPNSGQPGGSGIVIIRYPIAIAGL